MSSLPRTRIAPTVRDAGSGSSTLVGVIPNGDQTAVYVDVDGLLPCLRIPRKDLSPRRNVGQAAELFTQHLGVSVTVQRPLWVAGKGDSLRAYVLEPSEALPDRWVSLEKVELPGWEGRERELRSALRAEDGSPGWYEPGFRGEVSEWINALLGRDGADSLLLRQIRHWTLAAVWAVESTRGSFFFKAVSAHEGEGVKTAELARVWPNAVPEVIGADSSRGWLLTRDVGGTPISANWDPRLWARAAHEFGHMQVQSVDRHDELREIGRDVRSLRDVYRDAHSLIQDLSSAREPHGLAEHELEALEKRLPHWLGALEDLVDDSEIFALSHGDFDAHQIISTDGTLKILDWGEAAYAHPVLDIENYLRTLREGGRLRGRSRTLPRRLAYSVLRRLRPRQSSDDPTARYHDDVFGAYLDAWRGHGYYPVIERSRRLVARSFPLVRAVAYWRGFKTIRNEWELEITVEDYLRGFVGT